MCPFQPTKKVAECYQSQAPLTFRSNEYLREGGHHHQHYNEWPLNNYLDEAQALNKECEI